MEGWLAGRQAAEVRTRACDAMRCFAFACSRASVCAYVRALMHTREVPLCDQSAPVKRSQGRLYPDSTAGFLALWAPAIAQVL